MAIAVGLVLSLLVGSACHVNRRVAAALVVLLVVGSCAVSCRWAGERKVVFSEPRFAPQEQDLTVPLWRPVVQHSYRGGHFVYNIPSTATRRGPVVIRPRIDLEFRQYKGDLFRATTGKWSRCFRCLWDGDRIRVYDHFPVTVWGFSGPIRVVQEIEEFASNIVTIHIDFTYWPNGLHAGETSIPMSLTVEVRSRAPESQPAEDVGPGAGTRRAAEPGEAARL